MSFFLETKQQSQATTIENLKSETGWEFTVLLIKKTECTRKPVSSLLYIVDIISVYQVLAFSCGKTKKTIRPLKNSTIVKREI